MRAQELAKRGSAIDLQLEAYNARDLEQFLSAFCEDAIIEECNGKRLCSGVEDIRRVYASLFASCPALHAEIVEELELHRFVAHRERVVGFGVDSEAVHQVLVTYELRDARIHRMRFYR